LPFPLLPRPPSLPTPSQSATDKLSADDFAKFFVDKVAKIRASTAAAAAPVIIPRDVLPLTELEPTIICTALPLWQITFITNNGKQYYTTKI